MSFDATNSLAVNEIIGNKKLKKNDVLIFSSQNQNGTTYVHSGRLKKVKGKWWIMSKIGEGPLVVTSLNTVQKEYSSLINKIEIYRFDKKRSKLKKR